MICTFEKLLQSTEREGISETIEWLRNHTFYTDPASARFYDNYEGGLLAHSLKAYDCALNIRKQIIYQQPQTEPYLSMDSIKLCTLLHDICKVGLYRKNQEAKYSVSRNHSKQGHGRLSVKLLEEIGLELDEEEKLAIRWHMGPWTNDFTKNEWPEDYKEVMTHPLAKLVHLADKASVKH